MVINNANTFLPPTPVIPGTLLVTNITNAYQAVVTIVDSIENTYIPGQLLYFVVPNTYGMTQINGQYGKIISISGLNFTTDVNSTMYDTFTIPSGPVEKPASVTPAGSRNLQYNNFTNKVPFQSLNNQGN